MGVIVTCKTGSAIVGLEENGDDSSKITPIVASKETVCFMTLCLLFLLWLRLRQTP